jgi:AraC-like DNA-binding protein
MIFHIHQPIGFLSSFIESLVFYADYSPDHVMERLLPDGKHNLIIDLTDRPKGIFDNYSLAQIQTCKGAWLSGARNELLTIDAGGAGSSMLVITFRPGGAFHFAHFPICEITGQVIEADLAFGRLVQELRERLLASTSPLEKFHLTETYLNSQILKEEIPQVISYATALITNEPTTNALRQLTQLSGYSQKHFIALFKKYTGLTPKAYQKVQRFQKVIRDLEESQNVNWTRLALDCGYYDQAHFINEFRSFSGFNPEKYLIEKGPEMNYVPVR